MMIGINRAYCRRGFTVIEMLVAVVILAVLMAIGLPLYLKSAANSEKTACRANMQSIANAVQAARVRTQAQDYTGLIADNSTGIDLNELTDLKAIPVCPHAGTYTLINGIAGGGHDFAVACSATDQHKMMSLVSFSTMNFQYASNPSLIHGTFQPGVDHD